MKKTLLVDFDGVLHSYDGNFSPELNPPLPKARHACCILARTFKLVCFTTRPAEQVEPWLKRWGFPKMLVTNEKLPAFAIIDDRALLFKGEWSEDFLKEVKNFTPHWKREGVTQAEPLSKEDPIYALQEEEADGYSPLQPDELQ